MGSATTRSCSTARSSSSMPRMCQTSTQARRHLLLEEPGASIVLTHANGAAFVRDEAEGNPATVLSIMPSVRELQALADGLDFGLSVHGKTVSNEATNESWTSSMRATRGSSTAALMTRRV